MSYFRRASDPRANPAFFPTFLAPSLPFRRKSRHNSNDSTSSTTSTTSTSSHLSTASTSTSISTTSPFSSSTTTLPPSAHPILPPTSALLSGHTSRLHCSKCSTDLCLTSQIISKGFTGRHGRAYLVQGSPSHIEVSEATAALPNTWLDRPVPRNLVTGQHTVSDVSCKVCGTVLGWKYVEAAEESQKYKVGKFILETKRIRVGVNWENDEEVEGLGPIDEQRAASGGEAEVEFDSQDEDECEDLFAGVWNLRLARKRKERRMRLETRGRAGSLWTGRERVGEGGGKAERARSEDTFC